MAKAIYGYFKKQSNIDASASSMDDLKYDEAAPIIRKTWALLMRDKDKVGATIYENILTKEITMSRLFIQTNIQQQSDIFMVMMGKVVSFLDEPSTMDDKLMELGDIHQKKYGVKTQHFKHFRAAFLKAIKKFLPWSDRREQAWQWFWSRIINAMSSATQANHYPLINQFENRVLSLEEMIDYANRIHATFDTALTTDPQGFAKTFYKSLLDEQPDIAKLFTNTTFEVQSAKFIAMLVHAIKLLDDTDTFTQKLDSLSAKHVEYRVQIPMLHSFGEVLIRNVKALNIEYYEKQEKEKKEKQVKDEVTAELMKVEPWTSKEDDAWRWFWKVVVGVMSSGMTKHIKDMQAMKQKKMENKSKKELQNEDFSLF